MSLDRATPAMPVQSIETAITYYVDKFGFTCRHQDTGYAIVNRDTTELHLWAANDDGWRQWPISTGAESFIAGSQLPNPGHRCR